MLKKDNRQQMSLWQQFKELKEGWRDGPSCNKCGKRGSLLYRGICEKCMNQGQKGSNHIPGTDNKTIGTPLAHRSDIQFHGGIPLHHR